MCGPEPPHFPRDTEEDLLKALGYVRALIAYHRAAADALQRRARLLVALASTIIVSLIALDRLVGI